MELILAETHNLHGPLLRAQLMLAMAMVARMRDDFSVIVALQEHHSAPAILLQGAPGDSLVAGCAERGRWFRLLLHHLLVKVIGRLVIAPAFHVSHYVCYRLISTFHHILALHIYPDTPPSTNDRLSLPFYSWL